MLGHIHVRMNWDSPEAGLKCGRYSKHWITKVAFAPRKMLSLLVTKKNIFLAAKHIHAEAKENVWHICPFFCSGLNFSVFFTSSIVFRSLSKFTCNYLHCIFSPADPAALIFNATENTLVEKYLNMFPLLIFAQLMVSYSARNIIFVCMRSVYFHRLWTTVDFFNLQQSTNGFYKKVDG